MYFTHRSGVTYVSADQGDRTACVDSHFSLKIVLVLFMGMLHRAPLS